MLRRTRFRFNEKTLFDVVSEMRERGNAASTKPTSQQRLVVSKNQLQKRPPQEAQAVIEQNRISIASIGTKGRTTTSRIGRRRNELRRRRRTKNDDDDDDIDSHEQLFTTMNTPRRSSVSSLGLRDVTVVSGDSPFPVPIPSSSWIGQRVLFPLTSRIPDGRSNSSSMRKMRLLFAIPVTFGTIALPMFFGNQLAFAAGVSVVAYGAWRVASRVSQLHIGWVVGSVCFVYAVLASMRGNTTATTDESLSFSPSHRLRYANPRKEPFALDAEPASSDAAPTRGMFVVPSAESESLFTTRYAGPMTDPSMWTVQVDRYENVRRPSQQQQQASSHRMLFSTMFDSEWDSRASVLDALASFANGDRKLPFGGAQVLGEVIKTDEWRNSFETPYSR